MSDSVLAIRDGLIATNAFATIAMERGASKDIRRSAVRRLAKALKRFVENEEVRDALLGLSDVALTRDFVTAPELVQAVADLLTEEHARLLVATGYRVPPPPPASTLINDTRLAVLTAPYGVEYGVAHIESMYRALREFLAELASHSKASQGRLRTMLAGGRRVGIGAILVTTIYNTEFKLGDSFDFDATFSGKEKVQIEVTVPNHLDTGPVGRILAVGASNVVSEAVHQTDLMQAQLLSINRFQLETGASDANDKRKYGAGGALQPNSQLIKRRRRPYDGRRRRWKN